MALVPRLELRAGQALVMTPQLQQAIKLLQLSNLELTEYVESELEQNPLLERAGDDGPTPEEGEPDLEPEYGREDTGDDFDEPVADSLQTIEYAGIDGQAGPEDTSLDVDYDNLWDGESPLGGDDMGLSSPAFSDWGPGGGFDGTGAPLEDNFSGVVSLRDHLTEQLGVELADPVERLIALHLIDMLDESGYLAGDLGQVADILGCEVALVETVLEKLQGFDPPGIFSRDLAECLATQLRDRDRLDPAMAALLANLDLVAKRDLPALEKACGVDADDVADMVDEIRALNPRPALAFDTALIQAITPDVLMRPAAGGWRVELNAETLPRVLVNNSYYAQVSKAVRDKKEKQYIVESFQSANWLVKSLHQRATTILRVATEIVRQQDMFFAKGVHHLRPLVLKDIAEAIEMHESTVSRVTTNKYISTPRGIYELKYFFTTAIGSTIGGAAHSAESVRHRIKALIDAEPPKKILSDDKIVEMLKEEGVDIARRTIAKYRETLGIGSSVQRRREKSRPLR